MFFKDFVSVKRQKIKRGASQTYDTPSSSKNAGTEKAPASADITKLEKSIIAMFGKEEEVIGKLSKLRDAIVVFADVIKVELGKNEDRKSVV